MRWQWATVLVLMLNLIAAEAGLVAQQPAAKIRKPEETKTRTDLYGDPLPEGVIARLGTVRRRSVWARIGLSADGKTIVTVTRGRQVKYWDAGTGTLRRVHELPIPLADETYLSSDGRLLAVRVPDPVGCMDVWDIAAGKRLHQVSGGYRAAFSPDNKTLAVSEPGGAGKSDVLLWDMASGEKRELKGLARTPDNFAFSPDSKLLAASDGRQIICWNVAKGEQLWQAKSAFNSSLAFTSDGRTVIASPGSREKLWHAWDAATGKPSEGLKLPEGFNYAQFAAAPDGRTLLFAQGRYVKGADGRIRVWDLRAGKLLHTLTAEGPQIGPIFPDGKSFLSNDGALQRWDLATGRPMFPDTDAMGHRAEVFRVFYSPDGRRLASAARDDTIRLWDVATAKPLPILRGHEAVALVWTPNGKLLVSGGHEDDLYVWDTETGKMVRRISLRDAQHWERIRNVLLLHVTPDGRMVIALENHMNRSHVPLGVLTRWDLANGQRKTRAETGPSDGLYSSFSPDGGTLASHGELRDTSTGKVKAKLAGERGWPLYVFSSDGRFVAGLRSHVEITANRISTIMEGIQIWEAATGRLLHFIPTDWVGQLAFSPDGHYLIAADLQGLRLWELVSEQVAFRHKAHEKMRGGYGASFASSLAVGPDGRSLATGHLDSTILIWNLVPGGQAATPQNLPRLWDDLRSADATKAYAATWRLLESPKDAIRFLRERLRPVTAPPAEQVRKLLANLDSEEFQKRETATIQLREMDDRVASFLQEKLKGGPSLEMRRRVEGLLANLKKPPYGETLRSLRAVAVLERIGTGEAQQILQSLASGMAESRITRDAKASRERLAARRRTEKR